jgi:hypothetical protein
MVGPARNRPTVILRHEKPSAETRALARTELSVLRTEPRSASRSFGLRSLTRSCRYFEVPWSRRPWMAGSALASRKSISRSFASSDRARA